MAQQKLLVGQVVQISNDCHEMDGCPGILPEMEEFFGEETKITGVYNNKFDWYELAIDGGEFVWDRRWLQ